MPHPPFRLPCSGYLLLATLNLVLLNNLWCSPALAQQDTESPASYEVSARFDGELWRNTGGGSGDAGNRLLDHGLLTLAINGASALSAPGLHLYGSALFTNGQFINEDLVGSVQGISNIEAPRAVRLYESWAEWLYGDNANSIKFGLYDVNSEFDTIDTAGVFINPSHGIGPDFSQSGLNGPSIFPVTSLGLRSWHQHGAWTLQLAVLDGVPGDPEHNTRSTIKLGKDDGLLLLAETGIAASNFRVAAGYWQYTAEFDDLLATDENGEPVRHDDNRGYYGLLEAQLLKQQDQRPGLAAYVRYGTANADINPVEHYLGAGVVLSGTFPDRTGDKLGIAVGNAVAGEAFRASEAAQDTSTTHIERITELTYYFPVNTWLALQPDLQYVEHAGFAASADSAWVIGLRFELTTGLRR